MRYKLSDERKTMPVPISLRPMHVEMLKELEIVLKLNKSAVVQSLIEMSYKAHINKLANEPKETPVETQ